MRLDELKRELESLKDLEEVLESLEKLREMLDDKVVDGHRYIEEDEEVVEGDIYFKVFKGSIKGQDGEGCVVNARGETNELLSLCALGLANILHENKKLNTDDALEIFVGITKKIMEDM